MTDENYKPNENEEYMSKKMTNFFRNKLQKQTQDLNRSILEHTEVMTQKNDASDPFDQATIEEERAKAQINRDRDNGRLQSAKKALSKFSSEEFGFCESCGVEIGVKRLMFNPALPLCVDCAEISEKKGHLYAKF